MISNLNLLTKEELEELEKYVKRNITKSSKDVDKLFEDLKARRLKNRNIDVDALDFVCEGLSDIVENWDVERNKKVENQDEEISRIEELVCAPNTRVGKFLSTDKRKQYTLKEGIAILKQQGKLDSLLQYIADLDTRRDLFRFVSHDLEHTKRVLINADMLMSLKGNISERERKIVLTAIEYHDNGRIHDFEDKEHGKRAADNLKDELKDFSNSEQKLIKFIITEHCKSKGENETAIAILKESKHKKSIYRKLLNIMKDADKLDRVRFPEIIPLMTDSLDPNRLQNEEAKNLIKFACEILEKSDTLLKTKASLKNTKTLDKLFKRTEIFAEGEEGETLYNSVQEILSQNGYPKRSGRLNIPNLDKLEEKFIKDGYIYFFRGTRKGQKSGFYAYEYGKNKKNLQQILKKNPQLKIEDLTEEQSMKGRGYFISATTKLGAALSFSKFNPQTGSAGSIYIIKMKPEEVYKTIPPIKQFLDSIERYKGENEGNDEREYLIPDFVKPEEIVAEFDCRDLNGICNFIKNDIGLDVTLDDLGIDQEILEDQELFEKVLAKICIGNEELNRHFFASQGPDSKAKDAEIGFKLMKEIMSFPDGKRILDELMKKMIKDGLNRMKDR